MEFCALKTPADRPARPARGSLAFFAHQGIVVAAGGDGTINAVASASGGR
jgi:diacylglycerol kinase family enzyme